MQLKSQHVLAILKLVAMGDQPWTYAGLADQLGMSVPQPHSAIQYAPHRPALRDFSLNKLKYGFVPGRGELTRGMPTR